MWSAFWVEGTREHLICEAHVTRPPVTSGVFRADLASDPVPIMCDALHCRQAPPNAQAVANEEGLKQDILQVGSHSVEAQT